MPGSEHWQKLLSLQSSNSVVYFNLLHSIHTSTHAHDRRGQVSKGLDIIGSSVPVGGIPGKAAAKLNSSQLSAEHNTFS